MLKEHRKRTLIFVAMIYFIAIISTIITKDATVTIDIVISVTIISFLYIHFYPIGNLKKELIANRIAKTMGIVYIVGILFSFVLTLYLL